MVNGIYLTLMIGPAVLPVIVPKEVLDAVTNISVTQSAGQRSGFQVTFGVASRSLIAQALMPVGYFDPGMRVVITVTFNGLPHVLMDGIITRQEHAPGHEPGQTTLTITGEDLTALMDRVELTLPQAPAPKAAKVALVLARYAMFGIVPLVIPELMPDLPLPTDRIEYQASSTDLQFIQQMAQDCGYVFYHKPGPIPLQSFAYWGPEIRVGIPQPALTVNMDEFTNVDSLNFSYDGTVGQTTLTWVQIPFTKVSLPLPTPNINILRPPLAVVPATALRVVTKSDTAKRSFAGALAAAIADDARAADAVTGTGSLNVLRYGHLLQARELVGVRGAGITYDGLYYVTSVTHTIKRGEYKQSFSLARNGLISLTPVVPV